MLERSAICLVSLPNNLASIEKKLNQMMKYAPNLLCTLLLAMPLSLPARDRLSVKGLFKDRAIVEIDGKQYLLSRGKKLKNGVKLISANSKEAVIEIDGKAATYHLGERIDTSYTSPKARGRIEIWPDGMGMYTVTGSINGFPLTFLVDTGATLVAMNENQARRLGLDYKLSGVEGLTSTASGQARAWYIRVKSVKVGEIELTNVQAAVLQGNSPTHVLLGNSFLNRLEMKRHGQVMELIRK